MPVNRSPRLSFSRSENCTRQVVLADAVEVDHIVRVAVGGIAWNVIGNVGQPQPALLYASELGGQRGAGEDGPLRPHHIAEPRGVVVVQGSGGEVAAVRRPVRLVRGEPPRWLGPRADPGRAGERVVGQRVELERGGRVRVVIYAEQ